MDIESIGQIPHALILGYSARILNLLGRSIILLSQIYSNRILNPSGGSFASLRMTAESGVREGRSGDSDMKISSKMEIGAESPLLPSFTPPEIVILSAAKNLPGDSLYLLKESANLMQ